MSTTELLKPLRRDAAENRARLLDAAALVFAEQGLDGSVEDVAREAGVGMGTLYRRFPTKQALIDELVGSLRRELLELARDAAERTDGTGLEELLLRAGHLQAEPRGCVERLWRHSDTKLKTMTEFRQILREQLASAQEHGRIRPDVRVLANPRLTAVRELHDLVIPANAGMARFVRYADGSRSGVGEDFRLIGRRCDCSDRANHIRE